ncbi:hypothetical protein ACTFEP_04265, partial [Campylobacter jejuni]
IDEKTGEFHRFTVDSKRQELRKIADDSETSARARTERFQLQRIARDILSNHDRTRSITSGRRALQTATGEGVKKLPWR